jgi:hypothetical protein
MQEKIVDEPQFEEEFNEFILNLSDLLNNQPIPIGLKNMFNDIQAVLNEDGINNYIKSNPLNKFLAKELRFFNQEVIKQYEPKKILKIGDILLESIKEFVNHPILNILQELLKMSKVFL